MLDFFAIPPDVHSALLSAGPGAGGLLAAGGAWTSISAEYSSAAAELRATISAVKATVWEGSSAECYAASHQPYLEWLELAAADAAAAAQSLYDVAAAYTAALMAVPTVAEIAANHSAHAVLIGTNFFGINTIPIAVNEADYARMWVQASEAMTIYDAAATAALHATPQTSPAPFIMFSTESSIASHGDSVSNAVISRQALGRGESIIDRLFDILRRLVAAFDEVVRKLGLDMENLLRLLAMNPSGAPGALSSLGAIALGLALWTTIASIVWGFLLSSPAIILPIAIRLAGGNEPAPEPEPDSGSPGEAVRLVPPPRPVSGHESLAAMTPTAAPSTSSQTLSPPASSATASGSPPSSSPTIVYALGMRTDDPERDSDSRPPTINEVEGAAQIPREAVSATPATAMPLRQRRARRRSKKVRSEPTFQYEKISAEPSGQTPNTDGARIPSERSARPTKPPSAEHDRVTPRGRCDAPTEGHTGAIIQPLLPTTWVDSLQERDDS